SLYQPACFPVYGVAAVRRGDHMVFDRGHLAYLNWLEQFNCFYCSYANGVLSYVREIAARTLNSKSQCSTRSVRHGLECSGNAFSTRTLVRCASLNGRAGSHRSLAYDR